MDTTVDARKTRIDATDAWELLKDAQSMTIAKGKKIVTYNQGTLDKAEVLKNAMGPSGNLRAPTFKDGDRFMIGFHEDEYQSWFQ